MPPDETEPMSTPMSWESIQQRLGAQVWRALLVFMLIGAPVSALRATNTGWLPIYGFHLSILGLVLFVQLLGTRVTYKAKAALTILILSTTSLAGMSGLGLLSQATTAFVACVVLTSLLFSSRATAFVALAFVASISAIAFGFVSGSLHIAFDANLFVLQPLNWALPLLAALLVATTLALSISVYKNSTYALLVEVERQRDLLAH